MPAVVIAAVIGAGATAGATYYSTKKNEEAANTQVNAANHAADVQGKSADEALAFQKQQAENQWQAQQQTQKANYAQWAARESRISDAAASMGMPGRTIPDYAPGVDPHFDTGASPLPSTTTASPTAGQALAGAASAPAQAGGPINWTAPPDQLASQISAYFKSKGVSDQETPYWVGKAAELVARGQELNDPGYADKRLSQANVFGGGAGAPSTSATPQSVGSYMMPATTNPSYVPIAPALQQRSVGSYL